MAKTNWRDLTEEQKSTLKSKGVNHGNYNEFLTALKKSPEFFNGGNTQSTQTTQAEEPPRMLTQGTGTGADLQYSASPGLYAKQNLDVATGVSTWTDPRTGEVIEGYKPGTILEGTSGLVFVGNDPSGDTPEARQDMINWLQSNAAGGSTNFEFADNYYGDANQRWQWTDPKVQGLLTGEDNTAQEAATVPGKPQRYTAEQNQEILAQARADGTWYPGYMEDLHNGTPGANAPTSPAEDPGQQFFNEVLRQSYTGDVTLDQLLAVDQSTLTREQRAALQPTIRALQGYDAIVNGSGALTDQDIGEFMRGMHNLEMNSPEAFQLLMESQPELAVKYFASMGTGRYFVDDESVDPKRYRQLAEGAAHRMGVDAGYGEDGKQDGKAFVGGYGTQWNDVTNEGGRGDFMKLGRPGAMKGGFNDFIEDNPLQVATTIASVFIPMAAPALVGALGVSNAVASGIISAGLTAVGGGDLQDVLLAGLQTYGLSELAGQIPNVLETISPEAAQSFTELQTAAKVAEEGAGVVTPGGMLKVGRDGYELVNDYQDGINVPKGVEWQPHDTSDVLGDVQVQVPDYSVDQEEGGGGSSSSSADSSPTDSTADGGEIGGELEPFPDYWDDLPDDPKHDWPDAGYDFEGDSKYSIEETGSGAIVITHKPTGAVRTVSGGVDLDGAPSPGNEVSETTDEDVEDPNDWLGGLVLGPSWDDVFGDSTKSGGTDGDGTNNTGGTDGTNTTGGTTGGTRDTGPDSDGDGTENGDGKDGGEDGDEGPDSGNLLAATGLLAGAAGENDFEKFMYRIETNFPLLERLSPSQLLQALEESV